MFGSFTFDIAIGIVFVFLLLSLIASTRESGNPWSV